MVIRFHSHARQRMRERGATEIDVRRTIVQGSSTPAKFGRTRFRKTFAVKLVWCGKYYSRKQVNAFAAKIKDGWLVLTVIVKYF